jgi:PPK2 family polyphosphate:nucleotide phosphotransferase
MASASEVKNKSPRLADWQPKSGSAVKLTNFDPAAKPWSSGDKEADKVAVEKLAIEIDVLQNLFYADGRRKLLVVLQGTDTAGKDGTVRSVFSRASPLGVHTVGWKAPTEPERAHDYLWRIHQKMPGNGEVMIFNRSHYEDVLVPVVNQWITPKQTQQRYAHINEFERMLTETGTVILKFMLHIGFDEQRLRLQERLDDPTKHWKFALGDIEARKQWPDYQKAVDHRARQLQNPPQPDDCHRGARHPEGTGLALPGGRPRTQGVEGGLEGYALRCYRFHSCLSNESLG